LELRALLACHAVRLAARYAEPSSLVDARICMARGAALASDGKAFTQNEFEMYRALLRSVGLLPLVWVMNALLQPLVELGKNFAWPPPDGFHAAMTHMFERIDARDEEGAVAAARNWFARVDAEVLEPSGVKEPNDD
jgi:DNA-binding GntR family transcriptional regulator